MSLGVEVIVPDLGTSTQHVTVYYDGPGSPLALSVRAEGHRRLPVLERVQNRFPMFDDLSQTSPTQTVVVSTFEKIGAKPWLGELSTEHASINIMRGIVTEEVNERNGFVRRTYEYSVGWNDIPPKREIRSPMFARTAIDPEPGVFIGSITAVRKLSAFSPTVVQLEHAKVREERVIFGSSQDHGSSWKITDPAALPPWLAAEFEEREGQTMLRVSLTEVFDGKEPQRFQIPLVSSDSGATELLDVVAYP
jgi:hypothetical protein